MNITIYGAGNVGTQFAVHCASKGHRTTIFTSKPERISKTLTIIDENDKVTLSSSIDNVTNDAFTAFNDADLVFVIIPSYCMDQAALTILPYVHENMHICITYNHQNMLLMEKIMFKKKKVKDIFIEKKIPKEKRDKYPLLTDANNNILWIPNLKKSKYISKKDEIYDIILTSSKKEENK